MTHFGKVLLGGIVFGLVLTAGFVQAGGEKVPIDKVPKEVLDAISAKFPKADFKRATKEMADGKTVYEVIFNYEKKHLHGVVSDGKLVEIHSHLDLKDVPAVVVKAVEAKYPKAKIDEEVHQRADPDGKVLGFEITVEVAGGATVEVNVDVTGKILRETKSDMKKDGK